MISSFRDNDLVLRRGWAFPFLARQAALSSVLPRYPTRQRSEPAEASSFPSTPLPSPCTHSHAAHRSRPNSQDPGPRSGCSKPASHSPADQPLASHSQTTCLYVATHDALAVLLRWKGERNGVCSMLTQHRTGIKPLVNFPSCCDSSQHQHHRLCHGNPGLTSHFISTAQTQPLPCPSSCSPFLETNGISSGCCHRSQHSTERTQPIASASVDRVALAQRSPSSRGRNPGWRRPCCTLTSPGPSN